MPARTRRRSRAESDRAEIRRRARAAARREQRGEPGDEDDGAAASDTERSPAARPAVDRRPSLLQRFAPPAPPLAGKPDPMAGFGYDGPRAFRGMAAGWFLLRQRPLFWIGAGIVAGAALFALLVPTAFSIVASPLQFAALVGAGYLGWQRPWLYGAAAAFIGVVVTALLIAITAIQAGTTTDPATAAGLGGSFVIVYGPLQLLTGALAGWFGGYWRRRMAATRPPQRR